MSYKLTVANYDRHANFECNLLLCCCSLIHRIAHSSRSLYASYGGRRCLSRMSSILLELHSRSLAVGHTGACNLEIVHTCYAISRLPVQSGDSGNAQHNLKIAQTLKLRRTYVFRMMTRKKVYMKDLQKRLTIFVSCVQYNHR